MRVLAADIGATNARFAIVDVEAEAARIRFERSPATLRSRSSPAASGC